MMSTTVTTGVPGTTSTAKMVTRQRARHFEVIRNLKQKITNRMWYLEKNHDERNAWDRERGDVLLLCTA